MRSARTQLLPILLAVVSMFGMAVAGTATASVSHVFPALDTAATTTAQTAGRNEYVVLQAWETGRLHSLKAANPSLEVLVYKNLGFSAQLSPSHTGPAPSGVAYSEAPESWFLKNKSGQSFTSEHYDWLWAMDVGSAAYQQKWADNVIAELTSQGWDGVFLDDASATMKYQYDPSQIAKYPSDASYSAAMGSALASIGPRIRAAGKLAVPNFASWVEYPATYNSWLQYVSGALDEMFLKWGRGAGEGYRSEAQWQTQLEEVKYATAQGKVFMGFTQGSAGETQAARYGYGTVLLGSNGNASYAFTSNYTSESWLPEYDYQLGQPLGEESEDASGVHRRGFEHGLVLVNPTGSSHSVSFGGAYSGSGLSDATGATMPAHSALVLTGPPPAGNGPEVAEAIPAPPASPAPVGKPKPSPAPAPRKKSSKHRSAHRAVATTSRVRGHARKARFRRQRLAHLASSRS
jgi:Hypothetical glycosyl hydrolase family 15